MQCFATGLKLLYFPFWDASTTKKPHTQGRHTQMHYHIHKGLLSVPPSPPHTVGSLPRTLFPTFASPSHSIFQTALCLHCLGRLLSVYNSLSTSSKTYCFSASSSSFSFVSLCPVVFCLSPLLFFSSITVSAHSQSCLTVPSHLLLSVAPLCTPISTSYFLLLLFCPFSAQQSQHLSLFKFIVFTRFSDLFFFFHPAICSVSILFGLLLF